TEKVSEVVRDKKVKEAAKASQRRRKRNLRQRKKRLLQKTVTLNRGDCGFCMTCSDVYCGVQKSETTFPF
ncbi:hypothetical protein INR49_015940, partial [Caranx melampygus]